MKTYKGTFQTRHNEFVYLDVVEAPFKWVAKIILKLRNSAKLIKIERVCQN